MATNFEFHNNELLDFIVHSWTVAKQHGELVRCCDIECKDCDFTLDFSECEKCSEARRKYFSAEHIEQPKLTNRERAFCEVAQTGWIARDNNGRIHWYSRKPYKSGEEWFYNGDRFVDFTNFNLFSCVKGLEETPYAVEDLLKLEVMEVQEDA